MAKYYDPSDTMRQKLIATMSGSDVSAIAAVKAAGQQFHDLLMTLEPCREVSLAKTAIEESVMWAVKGITS